MIARLGPAVPASHWLPRVAVMQQLEHDVVELHEAHVETLLSTPEVRHPNGLRIDPALPGNDLLIGHQRILNPVSMEIAVAIYLVSPEHLGVELERAIHVMDRNTEVLHSLEARAEGSVVTASQAWTGGALGERRDAHCESGSGNAADCGTRAQDISAIKGGHDIGVCGLVGHDFLPCSLCCVSDACREIQ